MHYEKYKRTQVKALLKHCRREHKEYKNDNIDISKSKHNFYLKGNPIERYDRILNAYQEKKKIRKDAVTLCQWVVTIPKDYEGGIEEFFKTAATFFMKRYGKENTIDISIHMDETSPHMHFSFVPIREDGRLCAKDLETPQSLQSVIPELEQYIEQRTHYPVHIQTGQSSGKKHKKREEYIAEQLQAKNEHFRALYEDYQTYSYALDYIEEKYPEIWSQALTEGKEKASKEISDYLSER